ncbi:hypothetical protein J5N97_002412 [Dioscorea zingiberensis]|uniref:Maternal effect embryo arrest 60 n=1 Tax=Dioscorea zingiberensis TaxID=325984 RepID=A0A9D5D2P2_9LILI|nr:hypothetical protein J5N97_002412 [Dioscorea zingiberensis]
MDGSDHQMRERPARSDGGGVTSIHITALDGIVNVNSLFTFAVFLGLAWNPTDASATLASPECIAGSHVEEGLVSFHVYAFSSFLFSSLVAQCLKQAIRLARPRHNALSARAVRVNRKVLRAGIMACAVGSMFGCGFLTLALVNVVQVKLGRLGCGSSVAIGAIIPLVILVPAAMLIYTSIVFYAFTR